MAKPADSVQVSAIPSARKRALRRTNVIGWLFASPWAIEFAVLLCNSDVHVHLLQLHDLQHSTDLVNLSE